MYQIISYILSGVITILSPVLFAKLILCKNVQVSKKISIIIILIFLNFIIISQIFFDNIIKTILHYIIYTLAIKKMYRIDYWKATLSSFIYLIMLMITDGIGITILSFFIEKEFIYKTLVGSLLTNAIICCTILIITYQFRNFISKVLNYKLDTGKKLIILVSLVSVCIFYCFYQAFINIKIDKDFYINVGIIIVFLIVLFNLAKQLIINSKKTMEYDKLLEFMKNYEEDI